VLASGKVGIEKGAAVPLGVSIPGALLPAAACTTPKPTWLRPRRIIAPMAPTLTVPTSDGRTLEVWDAGSPSGTPLLFFYGTPSSGEPFGPHVEAAAERGLRLVSFARPGYNGSTRLRGRTVVDEVDDARAVLDHMGIGEAFVVGWSGGGPHALAMAAVLPERVLGTAILAGVAPYEAADLDWLAGMGAENLDEFGAALDGEDAIRGYLERQLPDLRAITPVGVAAAFGDLIDDVDRGALDRGPLAAWLADVMRDAVRTGIWGWGDDDLAFTRPWGFDLASISGPVHIWQGAHDRMVPFDHGRWLAANTGGACVHLDPAQGHLSLVVDRFGDILDELLDPAR
jgi:pimeloyl-ACP methyl ester carboxylesterase